MQKPLALNLYNTEQIRRLERVAIEDFGIAEYELMQRAGRAAFKTLTQYWPRARTLAVFCGGGNNGGDGYVIAALAKKAGFNVQVYDVSNPGQGKRDAAAKAYQACRKAGVRVESITQIDDLSGCDVLVDALLGTGLKGPARDACQEAIHRINQSSRPVLAVDIASGVDADTGAVTGAAVKADITVTFIGLKQGLFTGKGMVYSGQVLGDDLQIPKAIFQQVTPAAFRMDFAELSKRYLRARQRDAHKGDFGHALIIGGDFGMGGAARMAAEACARCGSGLTTVACRPEYVSAILASRPEIMAVGISRSAQLQNLLKKATVLAMGPGLGQSKWSRALFNTALAVDYTRVLDADALNLLAGQASHYCPHWILTPHPGEAARLLGTSPAAIQADRFAAVKALQQKYGGVIVLKGAGTLVCDSAQNIYLCDAGNPGMACGGMGDVLTGVIAALLAQGVPLRDAACLGVYLHAKAADLAAEAEEERGLLALDLMPYLRRLVNP